MITATAEEVNGQCEPCRRLGGAPHDRLHWTRDPQLSSRRRNDAESKSCCLDCGGLCQDVTMSSDGEVLAGVLRTVGEVLMLDDLQPSSDYFDVGGTSVAAMQIVDLLEGQFGIHLSLTDFFDAPDLQALADLITSRLAAV